MHDMTILKRKFFKQNTLTVAKNLLGKKLVREVNGQLLSGMVIETEAYLGARDSACHSFKGRTSRNSVMFGPAGVAYVYFIYGLHFMLNVVTEKQGNPCAVLFRAVLPIEGLDQMEIFRKIQGRDLTNGPARLCQAMAVDKSLNGWDLTGGWKLWLEEYNTVPAGAICKGPRIGIDYAKTQDRRAHRRFWVNTRFLKKTAANPVPQGRNKNSSRKDARMQRLLNPCCCC